MREHLHGQRGVALVMALIFLLLVTMLAVSSSGHALLGVRMAGGLRNAQQARMNAEAALRGAEYRLWSKARQPGGHMHCSQGVVSGDDGCIVYNPLDAAYGPRGVVTVFQTSAGWVSGIGVVHANKMGLPATSPVHDPVYLIEDLGTEWPAGSVGQRESGNTGFGKAGSGELDIHIYRITARGMGENPNVVSVVQSTFDAPSHF